ncbi:MAG: response regulator [bacterium]|nr:response regulator [bacterium]
MRSAPPALDETSFQAPLRVLLVEDDPEYVRIVERALAPAGRTVEVDHVETLGAALLEQDRDPRDVVLLDLALPDSDPATTTRSAGRRLVRSAPVFVLTGRDVRDGALRALQAGVEDYFVKDQLDPDTLSAVLRLAVLRRAARTSHDRGRRLDAAAFRDALRNRIASRVDGESLRINVVELDGFSTSREARGEAWAQRIMREAGDALVSAVSKDGIVGELGEGVFAVVDGDREITAPFADGALEEAMALSPEVSRGEQRDLTATCGHVCVPEHGAHPSSLLAAALERARKAARPPSVRRGSPTGSRA